PAQKPPRWHWRQHQPIVQAEIPRSEGPGSSLAYVQVGQDNQRRPTQRVVGKREVAQIHKTLFGPGDEEHSREGRYIVQAVRTIHGLLRERCEPAMENRVA